MLEYIFKCYACKNIRLIYDILIFCLVVWSSLVNGPYTHNIIDINSLIKDFCGIIDNKIDRIWGRLQTRPRFCTLPKYWIWLPRFHLIINTRELNSYNMQHKYRKKFHKYPHTLFTRNILYFGLWKEFHMATPHMFTWNIVYILFGIFKWKILIKLLHVQMYEGGNMPFFQLLFLLHFADYVFDSSFCYFTEFKTLRAVSHFCTGVEYQKKF